MYFSRQLKRGSNFTQYERDVLLDCIRNFVSIIESKRTDSQALSKKDHAWEKMQRMYNNQQHVTKRSSKQLRSAWKNMKRMTKVYTENLEEAQKEKNRCSRRYTDKKEESARVLSVLDSSLDIDIDESDSSDDTTEMPTEKDIKTEPIDDVYTDLNLTKDDIPTIYPETTDDRNDRLCRISSLIAAAVSDSNHPTKLSGNDSREAASLASQARPVSAYVPIQPKPPIVLNPIPAASFVPSSAAGTCHIIMPQQQTQVVNQIPAGVFTSAIGGETFPSQQNDSSESKPTRLRKRHQGRFKSNSAFERDYEKLEHLERMKTFRLERQYMRDEHHQKMLLYKAKREYFEAKRKLKNVNTVSEETLT